jgi:hypothetical protein
MEVGSLGALEVAMTPSPPPLESCQSIAFVNSGGLDALATPSSLTIGHVVYLNDEVNEADVLAPNFDALFAKEFCDCLISLKAACPRYGKEIACILTSKASKEKNQEGK